MKVGIAGFGAIGKPVARALDKGIEGLELVAVSARDYDKARRNMAELSREVPVVEAAALAAMADVIVECVPKAAFMEVAEPALRAGRLLVTVSGAGILANPDIVDMARQGGGRIILATGALLGLDAMRAAAEGEFHSVRMITAKPPKSLKGAPYLVEHEIDVENLSEPLKVFEGTARQGAEGFPANVNVAAALSLAGNGPDNTTIEIWADPGVSRNTHTINVDSDATRFEMTIEGIPSPENPATGLLTPLSVLATLRGLVSPLKVGT